MKKPKRSNRERWVDAIAFALAVFVKLLLYLRLT